MPRALPARFHADLERGRRAGRDTRFADGDAAAGKMLQRQRTASRAMRAQFDGDAGSDATRAAEPAGATIRSNCSRRCAIATPQLGERLFPRRGSACRGIPEQAVLSFRMSAGTSAPKRPPAAAACARWPRSIAGQAPRCCHAPSWRGISPCCQAGSTPDKALGKSFAFADYYRDHGFRQRGRLCRAPAGPSSRPFGPLQSRRRRLFDARRRRRDAERLHLRRQGRVACREP